MTPADVFPRAFAAHVRVLPSGCWLWIGSRQSKDYGAANLYLPGGRRLSLAHHVALAYATGQLVLPGWVLMHTCDVRACVNPRHLRAGTIADNNLDMWRKGRGRTPPRAPRRAQQKAA